MLVVVGYSDSDSDSDRLDLSQLSHGTVWALRDWMNRLQYTQVGGLPSLYKKESFLLYKHVIFYSSIGKGRVS
jgi:hypothetical protein